MSLLPQFFFLNSARTGAAVSGGGGLVGMVLGFFALFFFQPYYNAFIRSATPAIGLSPSDPIVPLTLMMIAAAMFFGPIFIAVNGKNHRLIFVVMKTVTGLAFMIMSIPLFIFSLIHWWFYT